MKILCLVVNPIAGMGGRVGLKGTDGVIEEARKRGAKPRAPERMREALKRLKEAYDRHRLEEEITWLTASGDMGERELKELGVEGWKVEVVHDCKDRTSADDTASTVRSALEKDAELIIFCGGDGTARDVYSAAGNIPIFGIPSGVKMHSGVFAIDPATGGELLEFYVRGEMTTGEGEIMDLDEDRYRQGEWNIALFGIASTLYEPAFIQTGKMMVTEEGIETFLEEIADDVSEEMKDHPDRLFILGPGGTLSRIGETIGIDKTHLGVDMVKGGELIAKDCSEKGIMEELDSMTGEGNGDPNVRIIVSPIGGQGFFLGRGNLQIGPDVIRKIGVDNIIVVSVPQKLDGMESLRVDTGDSDLDETIRSRGSLKVLTGYHTYRLKKVR